MINLATIHISKRGTNMLSFTDKQRTINVYSIGIAINQIKELIHDFFLECERYQNGVSEENTAFTFEFEEN